jgi:hypothetical protein
MAKNNIQVKKWTDLVNYKKKKEIVFEDQVLFVMEELSSEDFSSFINMMIERISDNVQDDENVDINKVIKVIGYDNIIAFVIKKMVRGGLISDFTDLSDKEIVDAMNNSSQEVIEQINQVIDEFVMKKFEKRIKMLSELAKANSDLEENKEVDGNAK